MSSMSNDEKKTALVLIVYPKNCTGKFNHILQVDLVKLVHGTVLNVISMGTGFQSGQFLNKMTAETAWKVL